MKKTILDYFQSINCINVSIHGCNCCKTSTDVSKCVHLVSMAVKIEHTVAGHNHDILQQKIINAALMFMQAEVWCLNQSKNCQKYTLFLSKLICIHGKLNKNKCCSI